MISLEEDMLRAAVEKMRADPIFRQACCELYSAAVLALTESTSEAVHAFGTIIAGRLATLLYSDGSIMECDEETLQDAAELALQAHKIPEGRGTIQ